MVPLSSSDDLPLELLDRYLAGEATAAELAIIEVWIAGAVGRRGELESLRRGVTEPVAAPIPGDVDAAVAGVLTASGLAGRAPRTTRPSPESGMKGQSHGLPRLWPPGVGGGGRPRLRPWVLPFIGGGIAAAVTLLLVVRGRDAGGRPAGGRVYATAPGQRESVMLQDGTQFTLAPASRLRLAGDYGWWHRDVYLEGEAYFAVAHDAAHPFAVHAGRALAQDIGTRFEMRSYAGEALVGVVVEEGAVLLRDTTPRAASGSMLARGTRGTVDRAGVITTTGALDADRYMAWVRGRLVFTGAPLRDVLADIGRWYDVDVRLGTAALATHLVTTSLREDEHVDDAIADLAATFGVSVTHTGRTIVFAPPPQ